MFHIELHAAVAAAWCYLHHCVLLISAGLVAVVSVLALAKLVH